MSISIVSNQVQSVLEPDSNIRTFSRQSSVLCYGLKSTMLKVSKLFLLCNLWFVYFTIWVSDIFKYKGFHGNAYIKLSPSVYSYPKSTTNWGMRPTFSRILRRVSLFNYVNSILAIKFNYYGILDIQRSINPLILN